MRRSSTKSRSARSDHFTKIAKQENLTIGKPPEYDYAQYVRQIPGGMSSNLRHQLRRVGIEDKLEQTLDEAARVRAEFGYPIMVTPLSQFVGSQAAINVIVGERYKEVTDQTIEYALGVWGKEGGALMDAGIRDKILSRGRAAEIAKREPPHASLQEIRQRFGGSGVSDEEVLLRFFTSKEDVHNMRAAGPARLYSNGGNPLLRLLEEITRPTNSRPSSSSAALFLCVWKKNQPPQASTVQPRKVIADYTDGLPPPDHWIPMVSAGTGFYFNVSSAEHPATLISRPAR